MSQGLISETGDREEGHADAEAVPSMELVVPSLCAALVQAPHLHRLRLWDDPENPIALTGGQWLQVARCHNCFSSWWHSSPPICSTPMRRQDG